MLDSIMWKLTCSEYSRRASSSFLSGNTAVRPAFAEFATSDWRSCLAMSQGPSRCFKKGTTPLPASLLKEARTVTAPSLTSLAETPACRQASFQSDASLILDRRDILLWSFKKPTYLKKGTRIVSRYYVLIGKRNSIMSCWAPATEPNEDRYAQDCVLGIIHCQSLVQLCPARKNLLSFSGTNWCNELLQRLQRLVQLTQVTHS